MWSLIGRFFKNIQKHKSAAAIALCVSIRAFGKSGFSDSGSSTSYLLLPVILHEGESKVTVDWKLVKGCLSSAIFRSRGNAIDGTIPCLNYNSEIASGPCILNDVIYCLVYAPCKDTFFFISNAVPEKNAYNSFKYSTNHVEQDFEMFGIQLAYPDQPLLKAKQLVSLDNLLWKGGNSEAREKEEHFVELPPEICQLKIIGFSKDSQLKIICFSKDIGSSLSLLPPIMHRLESLLMAIERKDRLSASFPEDAEVTASHVLETLKTEKCTERFSLERLEVVGDALLKFAVGRHLFILHDTLDEGQLTRKRSNLLNMSHLCKLATMSKLQIDCLKSSKYKSISSGFGVLLKEQCLKGFFRGWVPTVLGYNSQGARMYEGLVPPSGHQIPCVMMKFASLETILELLRKCTIPSPKKPLELGPTTGGVAPAAVPAAATELTKA